MTKCLDSHTYKMDFKRFESVPEMDNFEVTLVFTCFYYSVMLLVIQQPGRFFQELLYLREQLILAAEPEKQMMLLV